MPVEGDLVGELANSLSTPASRPDLVTRRSSIFKDDSEAETSFTLLPVELDTKRATPDTARPTDTNDTNLLRF
jgi:hypothetical protein